MQFPLASCTLSELACTDSPVLPNALQGSIEIRRPWATQAKISREICPCLRGRIICIISAIFSKRQSPELHLPPEGEEPGLQQLFFNHSACELICSELCSWRRVGRGWGRVIPEGATHQLRGRAGGETTPSKVWEEMGEEVTHGSAFLVIFGCLMAYGAPEPGIRYEPQAPPKPKLQQHQIPNPLCQAGDRTLIPVAPKTLPILLHHSRNSGSALICPSSYPREILHTITRTQRLFLAAVHPCK